MGLLYLNEKALEAEGIGELYNARHRNTNYDDTNAPVVDASGVEPEVLAKLLKGKGTLGICNIDGLYGTCAIETCLQVHPRKGGVLAPDGTLQDYARSIHDALTDRDELSVPALKAKAWLELAETPVLTPVEAATKRLANLEAKMAELILNVEAAKKELIAAQTAAKA